MKRYLLIICVMLLGVSLKAQTYTYHYWFDTDIGNMQSSELSDDSFELDVNALDAGLHWLNIMLKEEIYSVPERYLFFKIKTEQAEVAYCYWFDEDIQNMQTIALGESAIVLNVNALDAGLHWLNIMLKRDDYSVTERYLFYKIEVPQSVTIFNYWLDEDISNVQTANVGNGAMVLNVSELLVGEHTLNIQFAGEPLSIPQSYAFYRAPIIHVFANPEEAGTVSLNVNDSIYIVSATANDGFSFVNWTVGGTIVSTDAIYSFSATEDADYIANFVHNYDITATVYPAEGGTVTGAGNYDAGSSCTLTATANEGYHFVNWTENGTQVSTDAAYSFTVTEARTLVANFELNNYTITATANPVEGGTITGAGTYNYGETATLSVTLNENYTFVCWTENGNVVSTDVMYSFEVTSDRNLVANLQDHLGVGELPAGDFRIYPNPADDIIFIESGMEVSMCEVYTETGRLVYTANDCTDRFEINVANLPSGTYIIRFVSDNIKQTKRFVKK